MFDARRAAAHERSGTVYIRHHGHVRDDAVLMQDGSVLAVVRLAGFPHEMTGEPALNGRHALRSALLRNISDEDVQIHEHLVRHDEVPPFAGPGPAEHATWYGRELAADYATACLPGLRTTTWLLTVLVRPRAQAPNWRQVLGVPPRAEDFDRARRPGQALDRRLGRLEDRVSACVSALAPYGPRRLGVRRVGGVAFSEIAEAHKLALYARWSPVPMVAPGSLGASIYTDRVICSTSCFRVEAPGRPDHLKPHGTMIGFRVYPVRAGGSACSTPPCPCRRASR